MANETIPELLKSISVMYDKQFTQLVLANNVLPNITSTQMSVLQYMAQHENEVINQHHLQEAFNLSKSTVSGIVQRLQAHGFIDSHPMPDDKRFNQIVITPAFRQQMQQHDQEFQHQLEVMANRLVEGMTADETQQFKHLLTLSYQNLANIDEVNKD
ncbi:MarR family winged helix-turn-helix transcriptional regulator [Lacticaseibacillus brantae]|uniref:HTH marR-type domain-containing protein n=1 Tax=Lacticaseibacillus brantae DSM 23927 TaxID=1423727 RepID=A0A0R2AW40_9LACO|nr:MarR family transcriptional regulator [Lacticaseibacillus brantae]KRM71608.1 hypothetical protein FC34_GL001263 [Lacticaseibacillus brantae DSM 23927]